MLAAMNRQRLKVILPSIAGAALCLVEGLKLAFQFQASDKKDIATGHVEPILFAPVISSDWDYITTPQMIVLSGVMLVTIALSLAVLTQRWWQRTEPPAAPPDSHGQPPEHLPTTAAPSRQPTPARHPFGRAHH
jgi:hypothetical protein